jgi:hypothetical protein
MRRTAKNVVDFATVHLASVAMAALAGCGSTVATTVSPDAGASNSDIVLVRFRNQSTGPAVEVEFFASNAQLSSVPEDLFVDANRVVTNIGLAGQGILAPGEADFVTLPCSDHLTMGTTGGRFLDRESGEPRGQGQPRWIQHAPLGLCGAAVTINYQQDGDAYLTTIRFTDIPSDLEIPAP